MFDVDGETGEVYMSDVATNGQFALACAAQLGFAVEPDGPFIGRKGKVRLAALDGVVGGAELEHLARSLDEGERMTVVTKAFTDDAEERLAALSKGSRLRHAPNDLVGGRIR
jgi:adenine-specific DNA-methyltransferase